MSELTETERRELIRELAEKVMGWTVPAGCSDWYEAQSKPSKRQRRACMSWDPTESWSDAGMIVERMRELGWRVRITGPYGDGTEGWHVAFYQKHESTSKAQAIEETFPLAICLAARAALGGK